MSSVYKYRSNIYDKEYKFRQDTKSLLAEELYAAPFRILNDPFEGSVGLPSEYSQPRWVTPLIQSIDSSGIYSLSKQKKGELFPANELLWAHYADSHKGFCIEYDLEKLQGGSNRRDFDIKNVLSVAYEYERPEVTEDDDDFSIQKKTFGTKSNPWEHENEIRLVFKTDGVKPIPNDAIKSIYFGLKIGYSERKMITESLKDKNITLYQIGRVENLYKLDAVELDFNSEYEIISTRHNERVENYTVLYKSNNKDKNSLIDFVMILRAKYKRLANFTIIDDVRADKILNDYKPREQMSDEEINIMSKHWVALSTFDAPDSVFMYPER